jgi:hypothetical protein
MGHGNRSTDQFQEQRDGVIDGSSAGGADRIEAGAFIGEKLHYLADSSCVDVCSTPVTAPCMTVVPVGVAALTWESSS